MTELKHTPGPYEHRADRTVAANGTPLARCYAGRNAAANGQLFAAAPELLEALKACRLELDYCQKQLAAYGQTGSANDSVSRALANGAEAIAKATQP